MREETAEKIESILESVRDQLERNGADAKTIKAALFAAEDLLLVLFSDPDCRVKSCKVIRNTTEFALETVCTGPETLVDRLKDPEELFILNRICKNRGYKFTVEREGDLIRTHLLLERYHALLSNIAFCLGFLGKDRKKYYKAVLFQVVSILINLLIPYLTGRIIVSYTENVLSQLVITVLVLMLCRFLYAYTFYYASIFYTRADYGLEKRLVVRIIDEVFRIRPEVTEATGSGPFLHRVTEDAQQIPEGLSAIASMSSDLLYYAGILIATFSISPAVFFAEVAIMAVLYPLERRRGLREEVDQRKASLSGDKMVGITADLLSGIEEVRLLNTKQSLTEKLRRAEEEYRDLSEKAYTRSVKQVIVHDIIAAAGYAAVLIFIGRSISLHKMTIPNALILFNYYTMMGTGLAELIQGFIDFRKDFCLCCERIRSVIEGHEFPKEENGTERLEKVKGEICLNHVSFAYNHDDPIEKDAVVLRDISLKIDAGSTVAFIGKSGCGKTTLLRMLTGQRKPSSGSMTLDGVDYGKLDRASLYDQISVISQSPYIFNLSILENLLCARPDATMEEVEDACRKTRILEDILATEDGFDTKLGENGVKFSGGQCQRLALARAVLRNTPLIVLDEATSALDNITQNCIMDTISNLEGEHTVIIVAHRLSTIKNADKIFMIADHTVRDSGTHEELMSRNEEYRNLYASESDENGEK